MDQELSAGTSEQTHPSLDLVRTIVVSLDRIEKRLDGDLARIESKVDENGRKSDERHRQTAEQLTHLKTQIERLGHDDKLHQHEVLRLKERMATLEVRFARYEDDGYRALRQSGEGIEQQRAALEAAMIIAQKRDEETAALAAAAKAAAEQAKAASANVDETSQQMRAFFAEAAKVVTPEVHRARRFIVPAVVVGAVLAGFLAGMTTKVPVKTQQAQTRQESAP